LSWKLTIKDIVKYKAIFAVCDKDHDGKIIAAEKRNIMRTLGKIFSDKEFNEKKTKENGYLELDKFLNLMADIKTEENALKIEQTNLINTFAYLDRNQNEIIDYNEFKHILTMISKKFCPKEVQKIK